MINHFLRLVTSHCQRPEPLGGLAAIAGARTHGESFPEVIWAQRLSGDVVVHLAREKRAVSVSTAGRELSVVLLDRTIRRVR